MTANMNFHESFVKESHYFIPANAKITTENLLTRKLLLIKNKILTQISSCQETFEGRSEKNQ